MAKTAEEACGEYEFWAFEITRLTEEMSLLQCPDESDAESDTGWPGSPSCFREESERRVSDGPEPDDGTRRLRLDEIEPLVADCPECSRLVKLIRARKAARQQYGIAKRRIRAIGKRVISATGEP